MSSTSCSLPSSSRAIDRDLTGTRDGDAHRPLRWTAFEDRLDPGLVSGPHHDVDEVAVLNDGFLISAADLLRTG